MSTMTIDFYHALLNVDKLRAFTAYCTAFSVAGIVLNLVFLAVTRLKRVECFQEVLVFMRNISVGYIFVSVTILLVAPQSVTVGTCNIRIPFGLLAQLEPATLSGLSSFGVGCYLYTVLSFCVMFLYRYNVTCKTLSMSTIFSRKNAVIFLGVAALFSLIQSILFHYSSVDPNYLLERLNRSKAETVPALRAGPESDSGAAGDATTPLTANNEPSVGFAEGANSTAQRSQPISVTAVSRVTSVFGTDYTRNPMLFLSAGILTASNVVCSLITLTSSLVVACKLRGRQENMSDKSQSEHQKLMNVLILDAYLPVLLIVVPAANYFVCLVRQESLPFQEYLGMFVMAPIPVIFPLINLFLVTETRSATFQLLFCTFWTNKRNQAEKERQSRVADDEDVVQSYRTLGNSTLGVGSIKFATTSAANNSCLKVGRGPTTADDLVGTSGGRSSSAAAAIEEAAQQAMSQSAENVNVSSLMASLGSPIPK